MTGALTSRLAITRKAAGLGFAEYRASYTLRSWIFGWGLRLVFQVIFFATIGKVVGGEDTVRYLAIGNIVGVGTIESAASVLSIVRDRRNGTMSLLIAAPGDHLVALLSRGLDNVLAGFISSMAVMLVIVPVFGIPLPGAATLAVAPIIALVCFSVYCYGAFIGAIVMRFPNAGWGALNVSYLLLMAFTGIDVPVSYWPGAIGGLTALFPVTHGLSALRHLLAGAPAGSVLGQVALEAAVSVGWLAAAALLLAVLIKRDRRSGGLDTSR
ncbi:ABC transporter permease [Streptacidiphilus sp. 4-A2]|nr:ABC transporter permease [Streptacidiphilus sp. 4-A2]